VAYNLSIHHSIESNPEAMCDALDYSARAVALERNNAEIWWDRSLVLLNTAFVPESLAAINTALQIDAKVAAMWITQGNILAQLERGDEAVKSYDRAVTLSRNRETGGGVKLSYGLARRARVLRSLNRLEEARRDVAEIVQTEGREGVPEDLEDLL
jgi:tetratricopeptide (TPR) repeat protein